MKLKKEEKQLLFLGFSLINIPDIKKQCENERDKLILEIMVFFKKNVAFIISDISDNYLNNFIEKNNILINSINKPYIDFIVGSVMISNILSNRTKNEDKDVIIIEKFLYISSVYYDLYSDILLETEDVELLELYKNSFELGNKLVRNLGN